MSDVGSRSAEACRREMLARHGHFQVESCGCGLIHLTFGFVTVRIAPSAVDALCAVLLEAVQAERPSRAAH